MELVRVPQINANEDELDVVEVYVSEGQKVGRGELLCSLESTKASVDLEAPTAGFVRRLGVEAGERIGVGEVICVLTETMEEVVDPGEKARRRREDGPRATRRAAALAEEYKLDLSTIGKEGIVTEKDVLKVIGKSPGDLRSPGDRPRPSAVRVRPSNAEAIVVYGAGGHARVVIDTIREGRRDLRVVGVIDDGDNLPEQVLGVPVLGDASRLVELRERGVGMAALGVGAVTHNALRAEIYERLKREGFHLPNLIHPRAVVEPSVVMGKGNQIFAGAVVSSNVELGDNTIINSNVVVSHDCRIEDHVHLTPGALLAGSVTVGARTVVGMGVTVYLGVSIGADVVVANGNHILQDIEEQTVYRAARSPSKSSGQS